MCLNVILGFVLLEMATGKSSKKLPLKQEYKKVSGDLGSALDYVFEMKNSIHDVRIVLCFVLPCIFTMLTGSCALVKADCYPQGTYERL